MNLKRLLLRKKEAILQEWLRGIFDSYILETGGFLLNQDDRFANPVGCTISANAGQLLDALIRGDDPGTLRGCLEKIIRIRAVQDFTPTQAVSFMPELKTIISSQIMHDAIKHGLLDELNSIETTIDSLSCAAAELHIKMKRQIRELAIKETLKADGFKAHVISIRKVR
jgi:hypothetical protein